ncbi:MAG: sugar ABC transporter permease [Clostridiales bacterium]|nr:sugar ABC transporter permease [Clostridiales bacterium]
MKISNKKRDAMFGRLMIAPSVIGVSIFVLIPFADVIRRSFSEAMSRKYVGLANYQSVFTSSAFKLAATNTLKFLVVCIPLLLISSLLVSLLLSSIKKLREFFKSVLLLPMAIPAASVVLLWRMLFHQQGLVNGVLTQLSIEPKNFLNSNTAFGVLVFTYIWKNIGYDMVLWVAGLTGIPTELYEAASIDGASVWKKLRYITVPQLKPTIFIVTVLSLINSFKVFREAYLISGNYPHECIYMLQNLFNNWFTALDIQKLSAAAVVVAAFILLFIVILQRLTKDD